MNDHQQPPANDRPPLSITVSLSEIYKALCPSCQEAFLSLLEGKAHGEKLREGLRRQLEAQPSPATAQGPQDPPQS